MSHAPDSERAISALNDRWAAAFKRANVDAIIELLAPDYVLWAAGAPPLIGRESLGQRVILVLRRDEAGSWRFARGFSQPGPTA